MKTLPIAGMLKFDKPAGVWNKLDGANGHATINIGNIVTGYSYVNIYYPQTIKNIVVANANFDHEETLAGLKAGVVTRTLDLITVKYSKLDGSGNRVVATNADIPDGATLSIKGYIQVEPWEG